MIYVLMIFIFQFIFFGESIGYLHSVLFLGIHYLLLRYEIWKIANVLFAIVIGVLLTIWGIYIGYLVYIYDFPGEDDFFYLKIEMYVFLLLIILASNFIIFEYVKEKANPSP